MVLILTTNINFTTNTHFSSFHFVVFPLAASEQRKKKIGLAAEFSGARAGLVLVLLTITKEGFHPSWEVRKKIGQASFSSDMQKS